jgi:hypothetical protein
VYRRRRGDEYRYLKELYYLSCQEDIPPELRIPAGTNGRSWNEQNV